MRFVVLIREVDPATGELRQGYWPGPGPRCAELLEWSDRVPTFEDRTTADRLARHRLRDRPCDWTSIPVSEAGPT